MIQEQEAHEARSFDKIFWNYGARHSNLIEPIVVTEEIPIVWKRPTLNHEKLAYFHQVQDWSLDKLTKWANRNPITIRQILKRMAEENVGEK